MNVILLKNVDKLGKANEVVTVKAGYGRNYLIPQRFAIIANKTNLSSLEDRKRAAAEKEQQTINLFKGYLSQIGTTVLSILAKAGTSGKIFGSVTNVQLAQALKDQVGVDIDRRKIELLEEVKNLGSYTAKLNLHPEVTGTVNFDVVAD